MQRPDALWCNSTDDNEINEDQRQVLIEETGFDSYTDYLKHWTKEHPKYVPLLRCWRPDGMLRRDKGKFQRRYYCDILDLIKDANSSISSNLCCQTGSNSVLFKALSEPREGVYGRIVIWRMPKSEFEDTDFLEELGPALRINPEFVKSLYTKSSHHNLGFTHIPVFVAGHVMVGDRVATMTRCGLSEKSNTVPIVLIADATDLTVDDGRVVPRKIPRLSSGVTSEYGETIVSIIERNRHFSESADILILPALLAVLHMDAYNLRASCDYTLPKGTDYENKDSLEAMNAYRDNLRRKIEEFEDVTQDALIGLSMLCGAGWSHEYKCESTLEYFTETINRARRFETYARDLYQMQIGQLSLEESRKSIELSNSQTEEGRRVKIFTVLAFVYVPLNLASSIFGMNIQQLNNSGQPIQTFLVTAVVILVLTGCSWLCTEEVNQYRNWLRRPKHQATVLPTKPRPTYSIAVRVWMLIWLLCNGHWTWVRETKAWWYILANSRADHWHGFVQRMPTVVHLTDQDLSAGDYVSKYMRSRDASHAFSVKEAQERAV